MSANFCDCTGTLANTGTPSTKRTIADGAKLFLVNMVADDGTKNGIDSGDVINQAYIDALVQNTDKSKRWYPVGKFTNVTDERADPTTESFDDGTTAITQQGVRTFTGWLLGLDAAYISKLRSFSCQRFGLYTVDECGNLVGSISKDGTKLYPIEVNDQSWEPRLIKTSNTAIGKIQLSFNFSQLENDSKLRMIKEDEMADDVDLLDTDGLLSAKAVLNGAATTTGFTVDLTVDYSGFLNPVKVTGRLLAGFTAYNVTQATSITLTSATEAPEGTYAIVMPAQTAGDVIRLNGIANGIEIEDLLITIPV
jgi:hypothetical protein